MKKLLVFCLLAASPPVPVRADFCLLTQNGLHLGQGRAEYREAKRQGFRRIFQDYDVVNLQEVMDPGEPARLAPDGFVATVSAAKGAGSYREHYAILTRRAAVSVLDAADYPDDDGAFARPPFGVAIEDKDGGRYWLVDIHVVFGRGGLEPRRREVAAMLRVLSHYAARSLPDGSTIVRVVAVGDWNLSAADRVFSQLPAGMTAAPDLPSSLNAGGEYASPYDHFLWNGRAMSVDFAAEPRDTGGLDTALYRITLSDHVGVAGYVMDRPDAVRPAAVRCPPVRMLIDGEEIGGSTKREWKFN